MNEEILCSPCCAQAKEVSIKALQRLSTLNRRTLDTIAARIYFYYAWSHEQTGQLADVRRCVPLRMSALMAVNKQCAALMSTVAVSKTLRCLSSSEGFHPGECTVPFKAGIVPVVPAGSLLASRSPT
eukprot:scaffold198279_cov28-Tisochrysis_lutea.AAC.1